MISINLKSLLFSKGKCEDENQINKQIHSSLNSAYFDNQQKVNIGFQLKAMRVTQSTSWNHFYFVHSEMKHLGNVNKISENEKKQTNNNY